MKMVMIAYAEGAEGEVMDVMKSCGQDAYTKWTQVMGWGQMSEPHLMSHVWPQGNNFLMACVEDVMAKKIMDRIRELRKTHGREGVKAFSLPVDDVT